MLPTAIFVSLALTLVAGTPQFPQQNVAEFLTTPRPPYIPIISRNEVRDDSGQVISSYQSADGTSFEQVDVLKPSIKPNKPKVIVQQGTYSYTSPDGTPVHVSYIADEKGFRPVGTHIFGEVPQVPDLPEQPERVSFPASAMVPANFPPSQGPPVPAPAQAANFPVSFPPPPPAPLPESNPTQPSSSFSAHRQLAAPYAATPSASGVSAHHSQAFSPIVRQF